MHEFAGLTVLITGAAGGIGLAMAERFAAAGARLALVDVRSSAELAARLGTEHKSFVLDLEDPEAIANWPLTLSPRAMRRCAMVRPLKPRPKINRFTNNPVQKL